MATSLDLYTIIIMTALTAFLMGAGMIVASSNHTSQERPLRQWGFSCLLQGLGWMLVGMRNDGLPEWLSIAVGNSAILLSSLCYLTAIEGFLNNKKRPLKKKGPNWTRRSLWTMAVLFPLCLLFFTYGMRSLPVRVVIVSAAIACTTSICAVRLFSRPPFSPSRVIMGVGFVIVALSHISRVVIVTIHPPRAGNMMSASTADSTFIIGFIAVVMLTFLFALMVNDHTATELRRLATHDSLTKTFNRSAFEGFARQAIEQALRKGDDLALLLFDIDFFKRINDTHGHQAGDAALRQMAKIANHCLRSQDIFGRYGGEEFAVLLPGTDAAGAYLVAERIRRTVEAGEFEDNGTNFRMTISGGIAQLYHGEATTTEKRLTALFRAADEALYDAKDGGRNRNVLAGSVTAPPIMEGPPRRRPRTK